MQPDRPPITRAAHLQRPLPSLVLLLALASAPVVSTAGLQAQAPGGSRSSAERAEGEGLLRSVKELIPGGGRLDWSAQGDRIAFDREGADGFFDVFVHDVAGEFDRCLTCETYEFRKSHCLDPVWHPSGDYLVITVQRQADKLDTSAVDLFGAGRAPFADLWVLRSDGKAFWQITRVAEQGSAVLTPTFDHEGGRIAWSERTTTRRGGPSGAYRLRTAQLRFRRGVPALKNASTHALPSTEALLFLGTFTPNDRELLLAGNLSGQSERGLDVYRISLDSSEKADEKRAQRLTHTSSGIDLAARVSPRSTKLAWASAAPIRARPVAGKLPATELWLMEGDGSDKRQLTRFNDALAEEYRGSTAVGDFAWSPDAGSVVVQVLSGHHEAKASILRLELEP